MNNHGIKDPRYFPEDFSIGHFEEVFDFGQVSEKGTWNEATKPGLPYFAFDQQETLDIQGFNKYYVLHYSNSNTSDDGDYRYFIVRGDNNDLLIYKKDRIVSQESTRIPVNEVFKKVEILQGTGSITSPNKFSFEGESLGQRYRLVISELSADANQQDYYVGIILLTQDNDE